MFKSQALGYTHFVTGFIRSKYSGDREKERRRLKRGEKRREEGR